MRHPDHVILAVVLGGGGCVVLVAPAPERLAAVEATNVALSWVAEQLETLGNEIMP